MRAVALVHAWALSIAAASAPVFLGMCVAFHVQLAPRVQNMGLPVQNLAQGMLIKSYTFEALQTHIHAYLSLRTMVLSTALIQVFLIQITHTYLRAHLHASVESKAGAVLWPPCGCGRRCQHVCEPFEEILVVRLGEDTRHDTMLERTKSDNQDFLKGLTTMLASSATATGCRVYIA